MSRPTIVAGWYTPDYAHYANALIASLIQHGTPETLIRFVSVEKPNQGWARNAGRKPSMILRAMDANPDVRLLWIDVDCVVRKNPIPFVTTIEADLTLHFVGRIIDKFGYTFLTTATMVINPSARPLIERWAQLATEFPNVDDEATLALAIPLEAGATVGVLDPALADNDWSEGDRSIIVHDTRGGGKRRGKWLGPVKRLRRRTRALRVVLGLREADIRSRHGKIER